MTNPDASDRFEKLSREELTNDIRFNAGAAAVGAGLTGGIAFATVEMFQANPSALELTVGGSSLTVLALTFAVGGAKNAIKGVKQRRRLDSGSDN